MSANIPIFVEFMYHYSEPSSTGGVLASDFILLYNDFVRRSQSDATLHPNTFNPLVDFYCCVYSYTIEKDTKNRALRLRGLGLRPGAREMIDVLINGLPGSKEYQTRTNELFQSIMSNPPVSPEEDTSDSNKESQAPTGKAAYFRSPAAILRDARGRFTKQNPET